MNGQYLIQMPLERFADLSLPFIESAGINYGTREALLPALALVKEKVKHLTDVPGWIEFFFNDDYAYDEASVDKALRAEGALERLHVLGDIEKSCLSLAIDRLLGVEATDHPALGKQLPHHGVVGGELAGLLGDRLGFGETLGVDEGVVVWTGALERTPADPAALGHGDASLREADAAMRVARAQPALLPVLADLLVRQGRGKEAASFYRKAVDADRTAIQPRLGLARALLAELPSDATARSAQLEHAAQAALDAMERSKAVPEGHMILGAALAWYGDLEQAARSLDLALTFDPRHLGALRLRAVLAAHAGAHDEVCALMGRAYGAQGMIELAEPAPLPFEWQALAAHLGVDQAWLR
jgi:tetratricopeptide (TPR) repeat protein